jgi:hypothetical protein
MHSTPPWLWIIAWFDVCNEQQKTTRLGGLSIVIFNSIYILLIGKQATCGGSNNNKPNKFFWLTCFILLRIV